MNLIKEHHHTLLLTIFLVGSLLVLDSFEARLPDTAIATTTPGQQSALVSTQWNVEHQYSAYGAFIVGLNRNLSIIFTGEVRKNGNLVTSGTVLHPGDNVSLTLIETASYVAVGSSWDTPPAPWADEPGESSLFDAACLPPSGQVPNSQHVIYGAYLVTGTTQGAPYGSPTLYGYVMPNCALTTVKPPLVNLNTNGMNCGSFTASELGTGVRQMSASCIVTTSGPQSSVSMNIGQTSGRALNRFLILDKEVTSYCNAVKSGNIYSKCDPDEEICNATCNPYDYSIGCVDACGQGLGYGVTGFSLEKTNQSQLVLDSLLLDGVSFNWNIDVSTPQPPPPTLTFTGNPTTITQGESSLLRWTLSGGPVDSCNASGGWSGSKSKSGGSESVSPNTTTTYYLECSGQGGSSGTKEVTITVNPICPASQTKPHNECQGPSCVSVNSCGASSCSSDSQCIPSLPDLIINFFNRSGDLTPNSPQTFSGQVKNAGNAEAGNNSIARFCIDTINQNDCLDLTDGQIGPVRRLSNELIPVLQPTQTSPVYNVTWNATAGPHTAYLCADVADTAKQIDESDESFASNCSRMPFTVTAAACPEGQTKPHNECQGGSCVSINTCGAPFCSSNDQCGGFKEI